MALRLRDITPRGLYPRSILIAVLPVVLLLSAVTYIFYDSHWRHTSRKLSQGMASDIAFIVSARDMVPQDFEQVRNMAREIMNLEVSVDPGATLPREQKQNFFTALDNILSQELNVSLEQDYWFDISGYGQTVDIRVQDGNDVIRFVVPRDRTFSTTGHIFVVWVIGATGILIALALGFLRNQVRSMLKLTEAAKAFGRGRDMDDFRPSGATEVREAARAVIDMKNRLFAFASDRTNMLAGISHDLRTPLTRLQLQLAMMEQTDDIKAARKDLKDMGAMLDEYLSFARGEGAEGPEDVRLDLMLREVAAPLGEAVSLLALPPVTVMARPMALKRTISNLISNAVGFGERAEVQLIDGPHMVELLVDDHGSGIPAEQREEAFRPFHRLDDARNQNVPGTGLGLALARDTARLHGGDIRLEDSPQGGLRVRLRLPH